MIVLTTEFYYFLFIFSLVCHLKYNKYNFKYNFKL